jgi:hypothetical protein
MSNTRNGASCLFQSPFSLPLSLCHLMVVTCRDLVGSLHSLFMSVSLVSALHDSDSAWLVRACFMRRVIKAGVHTTYVVIFAPYIHMLTAHTVHTKEVLFPTIILSRTCAQRVILIGPPPPNPSLPSWPFPFKIPG